MVVRTEMSSVSLLYGGRLHYTYGLQVLVLQGQQLLSLLLGNHFDQIYRLYGKSNLAKCQKVNKVFSCDI